MFKKKEKSKNTLKDGSLSYFEIGCYCLDYFLHALFTCMSVFMFICGTVSCIRVLQVNRTDRMCECLCMCVCVCICVKWGIGSCDGGDCEVPWSTVYNVKTQKIQRYHSAQVPKPENEGSQWCKDKPKGKRRWDMFGSSSVAGIKGGKFLSCALCLTLGRLDDGHRELGKAVYWMCQFKC